MPRCGLESSGSGSEGQARACEGQRKGTCVTLPVLCCDFGSVQLFSACVLLCWAVCFSLMLCM